MLTTIENKQYDVKELGDRLVTIQEVNKRYLPRSGRLKRALLREYGWKCQDCGKDTQLEAHHVEPVEYFKTDKGHVYQNPKGNHNISNGMLLCKDCHKKRHERI